MRVCHIVPSLEERHGGPSKSVRALANAEAALGATVELLATAEADAPAPVSRPEVVVPKIFPREEPARLCRSSGLREHLAAHAYDCIHNHALWLLPLRYAATASRKQHTPLVISPRGMLSGWAFRHHHWRKRLASLLVHPGAFARASGWHATSSAEADDIRRLGFTQPICVAPNGVVLPGADQLAAARTAWLEAVPAARNRRVAVFYSRFHRKKRLRELLDLWLSAPRGDWFLLIVGVPEEYSCSEIAGWIAAAGAGENVAVVDGTGRPAPFAVASLSVLPSHSENFGLVIAEALAAGVPALVTDTTPWTELKSQGAGWCVPWADYATALTEALSRTPGELAASGARGRNWAEREFTWERSSRLLLEFYRHLPRA